MYDVVLLDCNNHHYFDHFDYMYLLFFIITVSIADPRVADWLLIDVVLLTD